MSESGEGSKNKDGGNGDFPLNKLVPSLSHFPCVIRFQVCLTLAESHLGNREVPKLYLNDKDKNRP